jgi:hypothetical protein
VSLYYISLKEIVTFVWYRVDPLCIVMLHWAIKFLRSILLFQFERMADNIFGARRKFEFDLFSSFPSWHNDSTIINGTIAEISETQPKCEYQLECNSRIPCILQACVSSILIRYHSADLHFDSLFV